MLFRSYVSFETTGFTNFFGFPPDATGVVASINGDDAVELYESGTLIDVFGVVGTDGKIGRASCRERV